MKILTSIIVVIGMLGAYLLGFYYGAKHGVNRGLGLYMRLEEKYGAETCRNVVEEYLVEGGEYDR